MSQFDREMYDTIASEIETKTAEEVATYSKVFWKKLKEISGNFIFVESMINCKITRKLSLQ